MLKRHLLSSVAMLVFDTYMSRQLGSASESGFVALPPQTGWRADRRLGVVSEPVRVSSRVTQLLTERRSGPYGVCLMHERRQPDAGSSKEGSYRRRDGRRCCD